MDTVTVNYFGTVKAKSGKNARAPYDHQKNAMDCLSVADQEKTYSTLVVLPTGGGKTYTASLWLLKNAINNKKKVLWIAHRQMLLDQAAESFQKYAYEEVIPKISSFSYRIVSGSSNHDRAVNIEKSDDLLIMSKDSIGRNLSCLDEWLDGENEIYLVVDEAHHSTAKTYRKVISYVQSKVTYVKLIGLTATPSRTNEDEKGLLSKIYSDGVDASKHFQKGSSGIAYQIGLKDLINKRILAKPIFESFDTCEEYGDVLGIDDYENIMHLDKLPEDIADKMAQSAARNKLIVETYKKKSEQYGQTIVFAVSVLHAIQLCAGFNKAGINADYIVSDIKDPVTGVTVSREDNDRKIQEYRNGELQVLVNVNILTEGADLPKTKTVFLARPTVSSILMTQMVGRALRGVEAGGTSEAYIVSFIDKWNDKIAWVNPDSLFFDDSRFDEDNAAHVENIVRLISISKIEEFARILDDAVDTRKLEQIPFIQRVPLGMYAFSYLEENGMDLSYQVMVYDSTINAYEQLMKDLPTLFQFFEVEEEYLSEDTLSHMEKQCADTYFCGEMIPPYEKSDVIHILKYYAQYEESPKFYSFEDVDRSKLDVKQIAEYILAEDMGPRKKMDYINSIWDETDDNMLKLFFRQKLCFLQQLDIELTKLLSPELWDEQENLELGKIKFEDLPLSEIGKYIPEMEREIRDSVFMTSKNADGDYVCKCCGLTSGSRVPFQVDHIVPMNKGGKTVVENLQILCRKCNGTKGDQ